jgi:hypothetical protein
MTGALLLPAGTAGAPALGQSGQGGNDGVWFSSGGLYYSINGSTLWSFGSGAAGLQLAAAVPLGWASAATADVGVSDTLLYRDGVGRLSLRNTTTAQEFDIWGTTTLSKYLKLKHDGTNGIIDVPEATATTGATQAGMGLTINAADAVASTDTAGAAAGGSVTITAGAAARNTSGNANGGDINLTPGALIGSGTNGKVVVGGTTPTITSSGATSLLLQENGNTRITVASSGVTFGGQVILGGNTLTGGGAVAEGVTRRVVNRTSDSSESGTSYFNFITNAGATSLVTRTYPTASVNALYAWDCEDADGLKTLAAAGDQIRVGGYTTAVAGYLQSTTIGSTYSAHAIDATTWQVDSMTGTWTDGTATWVDGAQILNAAIASATAMAAPTARIQHVSGTTTVTSISAGGQPGMYTLIFDDVLTFTDGNNLKLAGNFVTTADDSITVLFDGSNYYETSRSVN